MRSQDSGLLGCDAMSLWR